MATLILDGERIEIDAGETLFDAADRSARGPRAIAASCDRQGTCKECIVEIKSGIDALNERSEHEAFLDRPKTVRLEDADRVGGESKGKHGLMGPGRGSEAGRSFEGTGLWSTLDFPPRRG